MTEIIVPWNPGTNKLRWPPMRAVCDHIVASGFTPFLYMPPAPYTRARMRNGGVVYSDQTQTVLVFNDADTICPAAQIREAVRLADDAPGLVFAYDLYVRLNELASAQLCESPGDPIGSTFDQVIHNSGSMGCVAISRESFQQVGGFDESYVGWGYEDLDFAQRCSELWPIRRVTGPVYHLWHGDRRDDDSPLDSDSAQVKFNHSKWKADFERKGTLGVR